MAIDSIGYPLPVIVQGYACLNESEIALARKDIDPARPHADPAARESPPRPAADPARLEAAKQQAAQSSTQLVSYTPGAVRTAAVNTGTVYSVEA